jgi:hypothetical protein
MGHPCELTKHGEQACDREAVVRIIDRIGGSGVGCNTHAARALREIAGARVMPLPGHEGAALVVHYQAMGRAHQCHNR